MNGDTENGLVAVDARIKHAGFLAYSPPSHIVSHREENQLKILFGGVLNPSADLESPVILEIVFATTEARDRGIIAFPVEQTIGGTNMNLPLDLETDSKVIIRAVFFNPSSCTYVSQTSPRSRPSSWKICSRERISSIPARLRLLSKWIFHVRNHLLANQQFSILKLSTD